MNNAGQTQQCAPQNDLFGDVLNEGPETHTAQHVDPSSTAEPKKPALDEFNRVGQRAYLICLIQYLPIVRPEYAASCRANIPTVLRKLNGLASEW
jgi:hypothetical protein